MGHRGPCLIWESFEFRTFDAVDSSQRFGSGRRMFQTPLKTHLSTNELNSTVFENVVRISQLKNEIIIKFSGLKKNFYCI